jgi:hypothetical protein
MPEPSYLGDGVYAQVDFVDQLMLTTGSNLLKDADNVIYLEPEVVTALLAYIERFKNETK